MGSPRWALIGLAAVGHHIIQEQEKGDGREGYRNYPYDHYRKSEKARPAMATAGIGVANPVTTFRAVFLFSILH